MTITHHPSCRALRQALRAAEATHDAERTFESLSQAARLRTQVVQMHLAGGMCHVEDVAKLRRVVA